MALVQNIFTISEKMEAIMEFYEFVKDVPNHTNCLDPECYMKFILIL